jgi:hypothetical protein
LQQIGQDQGRREAQTKKYLRYRKKQNDTILEDNQQSPVRSESDQ